MSDEPTIDDLKKEEAVKIVIEEEDISPKKSRADEDVSEALRDLGRLLAETIETAWNSQERRKFEEEVREGIEEFAGEVGKLFREARESRPAKKVKEEAEEVKDRVEKGELPRKARGGIVEGLQWLSNELARLAEQFSPPEMEPESAEDAETTAPEEPVEIEIKVE